MREGSSERLRKVKISFYGCMVMSAVLAALSAYFSKFERIRGLVLEGAVSNLLAGVDTGGYGVFRAIIFFVLGYFTVVPIVVIKLVALSKGLVVRKKPSAGELIFICALGFSLAVSAIFLPYLIMISADSIYWRAGIFYHVLMNSVLGLFLIGGASLFIVAAGFWILTYFFPLVLLSRKGGGSHG